MLTQRNLDATFAALADPTRRAILTRLAEGEATVNELAAPFSISQPAISRHVRVLADAGLLVQRVDGARRPCRLAPQALGELDRYLDLLRRALEANYERLDALLEEQAGGAMATLAQATAPPRRAAAARPAESEGAGARARRARADGPRPGSTPSTTPRSTRRGRR